MGERIRIGSAAVCLDTGRVRAGDGRETSLRPKTTDLLRVLAARRDTVITKDELFSAVWPGVSVVEDSLVQCVSEIRAALGAPDRDRLLTLPKRGYRLASDAGPGPSETGTLSADAVAFESLPASVLVLPFEDLSEPANQGHFADGMTEDIIAELTRWREVRVVSRSSANALKGRAVDVRVVAAEMQVRYVLEGTVRRSGDRLRVTAQLIDGQSATSVWADRFDQTGDDVLALQDAVTARLLHSLIGAHGVIVRSDMQKAWRKAEVDLCEYDYALRSRDHFYRRTPQDNARAIAICREGRQKFPSSGLLKIQEAWNHFVVSQHGVFEVHEAAGALQEAARLVEEGMDDPALPAGGRRIGLWLQAHLEVHLKRDYDAARRHAFAVVEAYPNDTDGLFWMSEMIAYAGDRHTARQWLTTALALNRYPDDYKLAVVIELNYLDGRYEDALAYRDRIKNLDFATAPTLAASLVALGRVAEAQTLMQTFSRDAPWFTPADLRVSRPYRDVSVVDTMLGRLALAGWPATGAL
jgi:TolB-like protein/DNA-binding winged helix-turn-helix (wHTH) protein